MRNVLFSYLELFVFILWFRENGLENVITLLKGKAEEVALPVDKVRRKQTDQEGVSVTFFITGCRCYN